MRIAVGDMWMAWDKADLFLFTSNGVVSKNGKLAMGGGIALAVRNRFKGVDRALGQAIANAEYVQEDGAAKYGLLVSEKWPKARLGAFQTKLQYRKKSTIEMVWYSTVMLIRWCAENKDAKVHLNWPAVGLGGLTYQETLPLISQLPDTVTVWTYDPWWKRYADVFNMKDEEVLKALDYLNKVSEGEIDNLTGGKARYKIG